MNSLLLYSVVFLMFQIGEAKWPDLEYIEPQNSNIVTDIISNYLLKYFSQRHIFISIVLSSIKVEQKFVQEHLISEFITNSKLSNFSYKILNKIDQSRRGNQKVFNLIFVDGGDSLVKVLNDSTVQPFHVNQKYLIIITKSVKNVKETLHYLFAIILNVGLFNVNILVENRNTAIWSLHFYIPYMHSCSDFSVFKIDSFSSKNYTNELVTPFERLFPPKIGKFSNCTLWVATFPFPPFVVANEPARETGPIEYDGIDIIFVNQISKTLNLVPKYIQSPEANKRGVIYKNGTATGAFGLVIKGIANMTIGTHALTLDRVQFLSFTDSYMQHSFIFAFADNNMLDPPLVRLLAPFQRWLWRSIVLLIFISIVIVLLTKKLKRRHRHFIIGGYLNRTPIMNMMNGLIGNVIPNRRMARRKFFTTFARTLTILWLLFWLIVRNAYQGSLYQYFQSQRKNSPFDTVEKVRNSNATIHLLSTAAIFIPDDFDTRRFSRTDLGVFDSLTNILTGAWDGVFFNNDVTVNYFNSISKSPYEVKYTRDKVRLQNPVFYFRKNSFLTRMFNQKIEICKESGLGRVWLSRFRDKRHKVKHRAPIKLGIPNILGIVQITFFMYLISVIVFFLEMLSVRRRFVRKFLDYLTY